MKHSRLTILSAVAVALLVSGAVLAKGGPDGSCTKGKLCKLDAAQAATFKVGQVTGATVWKQGAFAAVQFTTKTSAPTTFTVAVCGASEVREVLFEKGGAYKDEKTVSPKGKLSGCDRYELKTARHIDGFLVKPKGNTFKLFIQMDGKTSGFEVHVSQGVLPARADHFHFKVK
jgi:outer membrane lipoprotein-sorting protein